MKSSYFETEAMNVVITKKAKYTYLYVTRKSLKWMRVYRVENVDYYGNVRFNSDQDTFDSFIHLGAGINMGDTCFKMIENNDFK